jgi:hypothetical protein
MRRNLSDDFGKSLLRDALSRAATTETEVEVVAPTQRIDVYCVPDPARAAERAEMGLLGELMVEPSMFEIFSKTPNLPRIRRCLNKQHTWHHELVRRARVAAGTAEADADEDEPPPAPFPALVITSPGNPASVLDAYGCKEVRAGLYRGVWGLSLHVLVLSDLPRTRSTLLLRLLGGGRVLHDALADLHDLPADAWERRVTTPLLLHFRIEIQHRPDEEDDDVSAEIQAWYEEYQRKQRAERAEECQEARKEGERTLLLRLLRARFGELPAAAVARIEAGEVADIERWGERVLTARTLADVIDEPS